MREKGHKYGARSASTGSSTQSKGRTDSINNYIDSSPKPTHVVHISQEPVSQTGDPLLFSDKVLPCISSLDSGPSSDSPNAKPLKREKGCI